MGRPIRIGIVGDRDDRVRAHAAIPRALDIASAAMDRPIEGLWLPTPEAATLAGTVDALWCVPGSPYLSMEGALAAIAHARQRGVPFLGTCGGFQHALIEYARDVLGHASADHAETNPDAEVPLIAPLSCSHVGVTAAVKLRPGSAAARLYGVLEAREEYHCRFGFNPRCREWFDGAALRFTGWDEEGDPRVFELAGHPFFMGTLFQPELHALADRLHPFVAGFLAAAAAGEYRILAGPFAHGGGLFPADPS